MRKILLAITGLLLIYSTPSNAVFDGGYMSAQDIILVLFKQFDHVKIGTCQDLVGSDPIIDQRNRNTLGDANPATGEVPINSPNSAFLSWYNGCINTYLKAAHDELPSLATSEKVRAQVLFAKLYAPLEDNLSQYALDYPSLNRAQLPDNILFASLTQTQRTSHVDNLVLWALGTDEEIKSYGFISDVNQFRQDLLKFLEAKAGLTLAQATNISVLILLKRDEFLLY